MYCSPSGSIIERLLAARAVRLRLKSLLLRFREVLLHFHRQRVAFLQEALEKHPGPPQVATGHTVASWRLPERRPARGRDVLLEPRLELRRRNHRLAPVKLRDRAAHVLCPDGLPRVQ